MAVEITIPTALRAYTDERTRRVVDITNVESFGQYSMGTDYGIEFVADFN